VSIADVQARMAAITAQFVAPAQGLPANSGAAFAAELAKVSSSSRPASAQTAVPAAGTAATGSAAGVIAEAKSYLGVPYVWGGTNPKTGLDCSGLTQLVYGHAGVDLPRVSWQQARTGRPVEGLANARPGDLLAFNSPVDHVAIYLGDNKMIHAPKPGKSVEISDVYETPTAIRRVLPDAPVIPAFAGGIPA
jgi:cell wall-associated NlpC family hydrolase